MRNLWFQRWSAATAAALSLFIGAPSASALAIDLTPKMYVWNCPPGFQFPIMECESQEFAFPAQHLEFQDVGDGFVISEWTGEAPGILRAKGAINFTIYPNDKGVVHLMANMSAGFDPDEKRNPSAFFETAPESFPEWFLVTGEKRAVQGREILTTLEYSDFKLTP